MYFLLGIGALGLAIAVPVAAFISLSRTRRNQSDLQAAFRGLTGLSSRVDALRQEVSALRAHLGLSPEPEAEPGAEAVTPAAPLASEPEFVAERPFETEAGSPAEDETPLEPEPDPETEP
jgi:hypothetical protein